MRNKYKYFKIILVCVALVLFFFISIRNNLNREKFREKKRLSSCSVRYELKQLQLNEIDQSTGRIRGGFFLSFGSVGGSSKSDQVPHYLFYGKSIDNSTALYRVFYKDVKIYEDNPDIPYFTICERQIGLEEYFYRRDNVIQADANPEFVSQYTIHIPSGSILYTQDISLDNLK